MDKPPLPSEVIVGALADVILELRGSISNGERILWCDHDRYDRDEVIAGLRQLLLPPAGECTCGDGRDVCRACTLQAIAEGREPSMGT